ncbi:uncharacterized protein si:ch211-221j21.3 [Electrophorus electricus]|uniref:uncharacterized protein si:ch211-221j21.3 n=1 Tax=Electrophorus electricus TaxID=8005 RepID=UPI0015D07DBE|nr:uncharacterized protein si:ch211-221j21.3 [Electrophorus electricus]
MMSMDYVTPLLQNKRRGEGDHGQRERECRSKRVCAGLGRSVQVEYGAVTDCRVSWEPPRVSPPNVLGAQGGSVQHCCSRCFAGESGHINHITQRY